MSSSLTAPGNPRRDARPPFATGSAPLPGAEGALRPTVDGRSLVRPLPWPHPGPLGGYQPHHPYVRRFWTAAIGPGAVADLMRLAVAAKTGRLLLRPIHLPLLAKEGLVLEVASDLFVRPRVPTLPPHHIQALPPRLRSQHKRLAENL